MEHKMDFQPDYRNILAVAKNQKPNRLPLYEHYVSPVFMADLLGDEFANLDEDNDSDLKRFFKLHCEFFRRTGFDTVSYEICTNRFTPGGGALIGECAGTIKNRADFENYPWQDVPDLYWAYAEKRFDLLSETMPAGMKAIGGVGNGVFEISEDLVGFEGLCFMQIDDPELFADLYKKIGELLLTLWGRFLEKYSDDYVVCRIGDDLGFKTGTLMSPPTIIQHIVPQYERIVKLIHRHDKPFLLHSCGKIFDVMDPLISAGIDAKHSNEDAISDMDYWVEQYSDRIGLLGGIDMDRLCRMDPDELYKYVFETCKRLRPKTKGWAIGSGNSIPDYVPTQGFMAMNKAVRDFRNSEK